MKTVDLQNVIHTAQGENIKLIFGKLYFFVPICIPDAQTQIRFNDSIEDSFTLSFGSWTSKRKTVDTQLEYEIDISSAQKIDSPINLIAVHQTAARISVPNKVNNIAFFDHLDVRKYHVDIDGVRYPRDDVNVDYGLNDYVDQYRDLKTFYKE